MIRPDKWQYRITQGYSTKHGGVDIAPPAGKNPPLYSPVNGKVVQKSYDPITGHYLVIKGRLRYHLLGHIKTNSIKVKVGQKVKEGQQVANFGKSGRATGIHTHWEIWYQLWKRFVMDPLKVLEKRKNKRLYKKYTGK